MRENVVIELPLLVEQGTEYMTGYTAGIIDSTG
jgi:hypothetical protein